MIITSFTYLFSRLLILNTNSKNYFSTVGFEYYKVIVIVDRTI